MLQDKVNKIGLRLGQRRLRELTARQIMGSKEMTQPPVSVFSKEKFIMNEGVVKPMKAKLDGTKTPVVLTSAMRESKDFSRYSK